MRIQKLLHYLVLAIIVVVALRFIAFLLPVVLPFLFVVIGGIAAVEYVARRARRF